MPCLLQRALPRRPALLLITMSLLPLAACDDDERASFTSSVSAGTFAETPCAFEAPSNLGDRQLRCGYVNVPEHHGRDTGRALRLPVAQFIYPATEDKQPPVIWLEGGPGASTLPNAKSLFEAIGGRLGDRRDVIFFDQRGTGSSQPDIDCPNSVRTYVDFNTCYTQLQQRGHDLSAYNSVENAGDVDTIRKALGYETVTLYGTSYGTRLGLHVLRRFSENVHSAVLDGVLPPNLNWLPDAAVATNDAFQAIASACAKDAACNVAYPDVNGVAVQTAAKLKDSPIELTVVDTTTNKSAKLKIDEAAFVQTIRGGLEVPGFPRLLPQLVYAMRDLANGGGVGQVIERTLSAVDSVQEQLDRVFSTTMHLLVACSEHGAFGRDDIKTEGIPPGFAEQAVSSLDLYLNTCQVWGQNRLDLSDNELVQSDVPTLLLTGAFDAQTPPRYTALAQPGLSRATAVQFADLGHVAIGRNACSNGIIRQFLNDPSATIDSSCSTATPVVFEVPATMNAWRTDTTSRTMRVPLGRQPSPFRR